ncbi:hypothetical protein MCFN_02085 [Mycoplasmopsis californica]|uniref:Uncharacterized protein n=2 Tax=Mycoplasmopsis californica TaxID=2113 RepID=A0A059XR76_9BACT|nr:hypothetical protein MCFN_02085 [Mycoplasmopsis californica]
MNNIKSQAKLEILFLIKSNETIILIKCLHTNRIYVNITACVMRFLTNFYKNPCILIKKEENYKRMNKKSIKLGVISGAATSFLLVTVPVIIFTNNHNKKTKNNSSYFEELNFDLDKVKVLMKILDNEQNSLELQEKIIQDAQNLLDKVRVNFAFMADSKNDKLQAQVAKYLNELEHKLHHHRQKMNQSILESGRISLNKSKLTTKIITDIFENYNNFVDSKLKDNVNKFNKLKNEIEKNLSKKLSRQSDVNNLRTMIEELREIDKIINNNLTQIINKVNQAKNNERFLKIDTIIDELNEFIANYANSKNNSTLDNDDELIKKLSNIISEADKIIENLEKYKSDSEIDSKIKIAIKTVSKAKELLNQLTQSNDKNQLLEELESIKNTIQNTEKLLNNADNLNTLESIYNDSILQSSKRLNAIKSSAEKQNISIHNHQIDDLELKNNENKLNIIAKMKTILLETLKNSGIEPVENIKYQNEIKKSESISALKDISVAINKNVQNQKINNNSSIKNDDQTSEQNFDIPALTNEYQEIHQKTIDWLEEIKNSFDYDSTAIDSVSNVVKNIYIPMIENINSQFSSARNDGKRLSNLIEEIKTFNSGAKEWYDLKLTFNDQFFLTKYYFNELVQNNDFFNEHNAMFQNIVEQYDNELKNNKIPTKETLKDWITVLNKIYPLLKEQLEKENEIAKTIDITKEITDFFNQLEKELSNERILYYVKSPQDRLFNYYFNHVAKYEEPYNEFRTSLYYKYTSNEQFNETYSTLKSKLEIKEKIQNYKNFVESQRKAYFNSQRYLSDIEDQNKKVDPIWIFNKIQELKALVNSEFFLERYNNPKYKWLIYDDKQNKDQNYEYYYSIDSKETFDKSTPEELEKFTTETETNKYIFAFPRNNFFPWKRLIAGYGIKNPGNSDYRFSLGLMSDKLSYLAYWIKWGVDSFARNESFNLEIPDQNNPSKTTKKHVFELSEEEFRQLSFTDTFNDMAQKIYEILKYVKFYDEQLILKEDEKIKWDFTKNKPIFSED